jgi:hypothetical protein
VIPALRNIVQAKDPLLAALPDREPFFFPDPPAPLRGLAPLVPMFAMTCPKCGKVWMTTRSLPVGDDFCGGPGRSKHGCGTRLPAPVPEVRQ